MDKKNITNQPVLKQYNESIKKGLRNGIKFTKLIDQLITTEHPSELLSAAKQLVSHQLNTHYVQFPHQYGAQDYYLVFMNRLLSIHNLGARLSLKSDQMKLYQVAKVLGDKDNFIFSFDLQAKGDGGAYYQDTRNHENLFYINLDRKLLRFDSHALTELFIVDYYNQVDPHKIKRLAGTLLEFATFLQKDYDFNVDLSILNADNDRFYKFASSKLPAGIMDKLFIVAAKHHYMLKSYHQNGAQLRLSNDILINIYPDQDKHWGLVVQDSKQDYSWFDILLNYDFLRKWYLDNLDQLMLN